MFYCAQCPGSRFETREVLATHYKTSSQWHPYCWKCDMEFADEKLFDMVCSVPINEQALSR